MKAKKPSTKPPENLSKQNEQLQQELTQAVDFVQQIKSGNLSAHYKSALANHPLAKSLLLLRDQMASLLSQEKQRNWSNEGIAKFADMLRAGQQESLSKLFDKVLTQLIDYVDARQGILSVLKEDNSDQYLEQVSFFAGRKKKKDELTQFELGEGLAGQAAVSKKEIYLTKIPRNYLTITSGLGKASPTSILVMPLVKDNETMGVLELAFFKILEQHEIDFIKRISQNIASAYFNMRINERTRHLLSESQQQELQLKEQETELRKNMNQLFASREEILKIQLETEAQTKIINSLAIVSKADLQGDITYVNDEFIKWSKYTREEVMGKNHRFLKSGDQDNAIFKDLWKTISTGRVWRGEIKNKAKDGSFYWVDAIIAPVLGTDGKPKEYIAQRFVINDKKKREVEMNLLLTESQSKEEMLRTNMEEMRAIQNKMQTLMDETEAQTKIINSLAIVSKADLRGDITYVNDEFLKWSKYTRDEVMGKNHRFLKSGDQDDDIFIDLWKTISSGRVWRGEIKNKAKDGSFYWVDAIIAPVLGTDGKPKEYIAQRFVINDKKEREDEVNALLVESQNKEEKLRINMDEMQAIQNEMQTLINETEAQTKIINSLAIVSKADVRGDITYVNDEFLKWSKYTREEVMGKNHRFLKSGDQSDAIFNDLWRTISSGRVWRGEIKNKAKDGTFYWVDAIIAPVIGADGKPKEYIAQRFVINDKKEREAEVNALLVESQHKEERLRTNMSEMQAIQNKMQILMDETEAQTKIINSLAIVSKADIRGDITYVNNEFIKWSQYTREEVMGKNHRFLKSGDQDDDIFEDLWRNISKGKVWRGEIKNKAKDGSFYWVDAIIAPVLGADGKPKEYIAQRFVINDKKEREAKVSSLLLESQAKEEELRTNMQTLEETQAKLNELMKETEAQTNIINSLAIVSKADVQGNITYVNEEFLKWSKYTRDEVIGKNHRLLKSGDQDDLIFADLWRNISKGKVWRGEIKNKAKDGTFYWVDAIIAPVLGEDGKPKEYIAQRFVINDKKEREEEMSRQNQVIRQSNDRINKSFKELQVAQDQLVQTEKMAFLGRLTSGVAHEINTPLGAIKASSENVQVAVDNIIQHTQQLMDLIPREVVNMVFTLIRHASNYKDSFTSTQRRAAKRAAIVSLQEHTIEQPEALAELMILLGMHDEVESWEPLLRLPNATEVLGLVYEVLSVKEQNLNIGVAVSKAAKILFALKKYSHQGHEEHATEFDIVDNLETVLAIYSNNLKQVEVIRSFEAVPKIMGYPDELNQVWTNLIHNSLQAMDGKGKMQFKIYEHASGGPVIEITDFGQGIPEENLKKIFDPFFTTKAPGEGTGLGLSIVKKIIDKHEGKIECESVVGQGTTFRVILPK